MATLTKSTGTAVLSGAAEKVTLPASYGWVWVKNMSDSDIFAGLSADISEGADGVLTIPSGECGRVQTDGQDSVYLMGSGNALVVAQNYADCPFKGGGKGGESPDLSEYAKKTDVPNIKVNEAGNADTVGGKHASDFKEYQEYAPMYEGDLLDMTEMGTYSCSQGNCTNLPSEIYSWCYITMTSFRDAGYRQFVCSPFNSISSNKHSLYLANEAFKDSNGNLIWDKFYSDRYKPYVTGSATVEANSNVCVSNHGFTPSAVIWWDGSLSGVAVSFSDTKFTIDKTNSVDRTINYLMFK